MQHAVCFGDSITQQGFGAGGWLSLLAEQFAGRVDILNRGCSGYTTDLALSVAFAWAFPPSAPPSSPPVFVTVFFGANDAALTNSVQHVPLERYVANLGVLIDKLRELFGPTLEILLVSPAPIDDALWAAHCRAQYGSETNRLVAVTRTYRDAAADVAARFKVTFVDLFDGRFAAPGLLSDGLHLTPAGNRVLYEAVWDKISDRAKAVPRAFPYWRDLLEAPQ
jgi:lysophospholipase L1-like esterase